jgi:hypothetical protein
LAKSTNEHRNFRESELEVPLKRRRGMLSVRLRDAAGAAGVGVRGKRREPMGMEKVSSSRPPPLAGNEQQWRYKKWISLKASLSKLGAAAYGFGLWAESWPPG